MIGGQVEGPGSSEGRLPGLLDIERPGLIWNIAGDIVEDVSSVKWPFDEPSEQFFIYLASESQPYIFIKRKRRWVGDVTCYGRLRVVVATVKE